MGFNFMIKFNTLHFAIIFRFDNTRKYNKTFFVSDTHLTISLTGHVYLYLNIYSTILFQCCFKPFQLKVGPFRKWLVKPQQ